MQFPNVLDENNRKQAFELLNQSTISIDLVC